MDTYTEGMAALYICLTVLNLAVIGLAVYYVKRVRKEGEIDRIKINVLVESLTEIFTTKQDENEKRDSSGSSDLPRRD